MIDRLSFVVVLAAGCTTFDGAADLLGKGGASGSSSGSMQASTTASASSVASSSTGTDCLGAPNEVCEADTGESCACSDCEFRRPCDPFGCDYDLVCTLSDACICSDCDFHGFCYGPQKSDCTDDGNCEVYESCQCNDCKMRDECDDNLADCVGGMPDGTCDPPGDGCLCPDCAYTAACLMGSCVNNGMCEPSYGEACFCPDCVGDGYCVCDQPLDGKCNSFSEGCACNECAGIAPCP